MERPCKEIKLPKSGNTARIYTYFTRGDRMYIKEYSYQGAKFDTDSGNAEKFKMVNIPVDYFERLQNAVVIRGTKAIVAKDGTVTPSTEESIFELHDRDFNYLYAELEKVDIEYKKGKKKDKEDGGSSVPTVKQ